MPSSTLDRIEALVAKYAAAKNVTMQVGPALGIASEVAPLLPLLREWAEAEEAAQREIDERHPEAARLAVLDMKAGLKRGRPPRRPSDGAVSDDDLVLEVCHNLINRALREENDEIPNYDAAKEYRAKEAAIRRLLAAAPPLPEGEHATWCPQCGPRVAVDEDGCCTSCGADATGEGADRAIAAVAELERIRRELSRLSERLEDTFLGGYSDPRDFGIFRHGMGTAASCVAAVLRGERNQAPLTVERAEELIRQAEPRARETHRLGQEMRRPTSATLATVVRGRDVLPEGEQAAAPAPGVVLSEADIEAIDWARIAVLDDRDRPRDQYEESAVKIWRDEDRWNRALAVLDRLMGSPDRTGEANPYPQPASPRPATLTVGEREAVSRARHLISSFTGVKDTQEVLDRLLASDKLDMVPPRAGALCRAAIKWREWARELERTAPTDADEELIAAVDEFLGIPSERTTP